MALSGFDEIKNQVSEEWAYFVNDSERAISEMADSLTPVYNSEIIREWTNLSGDDSDRWHEFGYSLTEMVSIVDLMRIDLAIYYDGQVSLAYSEIYEEKEEALSNG